MTNLAVIILTYNEELHIERCIRSIQAVTDKIYIVDSFSSDQTVEIARSLGAVVVQNKWISYSFQFNFGIKTLPFEAEWLMRMDADEVITPELADELNQTLHRKQSDITGLYVKRRVVFMNQWIRHGGYYPIWLLRVWRKDKGFCEELWMDEHIKLLEGTTEHLSGDIVDHNLNNLTWWTQKHNNYATREIIDLLNIRYNFENKETITPRFFGTQEQRKRFLKVKYASLPLFTRPFLYFIYRYFCKLGFRDGPKGLIWHVLQGFWYRFLVDAKIYEMYQRAGKDKKDIIQYFKNEYGKDLSDPNRSVYIR